MSAAPKPPAGAAPARPSAATTQSGAASTGTAAAAPASAGASTTTPPQGGLLNRLANLSQETKSNVLAFVCAFCLILFVVITALYFVTSTKSASRLRNTVVVFSDGNPDDLAALHFLLQRGDVSVKAIVASGTGRQHLNSAWTNIASFLMLLIANGNTRAASVQLLAGSAFAVKDVATKNCSYGGRALDGGRQLQYDQLFGAAPLLRKTLMTVRKIGDMTNTVWSRYPLVAFDGPLKSIFDASSDGSLTLVALSPLTDIAIFLKRNAAYYTRKLRRVVISGGTLKPGDVGVWTNFAANSVAEFNFFCDPDAARTVMGELPLPTFVVPLDASATITLADAAAWTRVSGAVPSTTSTATAAQLLTPLQFAVSMFNAVRSHPMTSSNQRAATVADLAVVAIAFDNAVAVNANVNQGTLSVSTGSDLSTVGRLGKISTGTAADADHIVVDLAKPITVWDRYLRVAAIPSGR